MRVLPIPPTVLRVIRVARVLRIVRLLKNLKGLRRLLLTLVFALPALANLAALFSLVLFMYAVLGVNMFTFVRQGEALTKYSSFETFGGACLLLFQCLTGDGWSAIMDDCMINEERGCDPEASPSDCGTPLALPYFISFTIIGTFAYLNIVIAVILDHFSTLGSENPDLVSATDIADFSETWQLYDPGATGKIATSQLPALVQELKAPLGLAGSVALDAPHPRRRVLQFCLSLGLEQDEGHHLAFKSVLDALIKRNYAAKTQFFGASAALTPAPQPLSPSLGLSSQGAPATSSEVAVVLATGAIRQFLRNEAIGKCCRRLRSRDHRSPIGSAPEPEGTPSRSPTRSPTNPPHSDCPAPGDSPALGDSAELDDFPEQPPTACLPSPKPIPPPVERAGAATGSGPPRASGLGA